jgi:iron complex transport system permease protein
VAKSWLAIRLGNSPISFRLNPRVPSVLAIVSAIALLAILLSVGYGEYPIAPVEVLKALLGLTTNSPDYEFVIYTLRLPRVVAALLVGVGLAIAGTILQGLTRNPLAAPEIIGIEAGAGLAAVTLIVLFPAIPVALLPLAAFVGRRWRRC